MSAHKKTSMKTKNFFGMIILPIMLFVASATFAGNTKGNHEKSNKACTCTDCKKSCGEKCDGGKCCSATATTAAKDKKTGAACCAGKEGAKACAHEGEKGAVKGAAVAGKAKCCATTADSKCAGTCNEKCKDCEGCKVDCSKCCTKDGCSKNGCCDMKK